MKYAKIYDNDLGQRTYKGEAILLNCLDQEFTRGFWEYKFEGSNETHCDWIDNNKVYEK